MTGFRQAIEWRGTSSDPNDVPFGDVVGPVALGDPDASDLPRADNCDAVLVGEPTDAAVIGRRGAREGPRAIREALASVKTHHFDAGPVGASGSSSSVGDLGDVAPIDDDVETAQAQLREAAGEVHATDALPVFLGGDNSVTYANVAPLLESGRVGVVNLDAHLDVREVPADGPTSGTPYRQLLDAGLDGYSVLGARHFETSTAYHDYLREQGGEVVTAEEVADDVVGAADAALSAVGDVDHLYVSVDCDVLDASAAPGVSAPTPGGLTTRDLFRSLRLLCSDDRLAGIEVVECAPPLDRDGLTVDAAARAVAHALSAYRGGGR